MAVQDMKITEKMYLTGRGKQNALVFVFPSIFCLFFPLIRLNDLSGPSLAEWYSGSAIWGLRREGRDLYRGHVSTILP